MAEIVEFFRLLSGQQPELGSLRCHLAQALLDERDCAGAIAAASEAIQRDGGLAEAWLIRAEAHKVRGDWGDAASDFVQAARLAPERSGILVRAAGCYVELDCLEEAERCLRRAVRLDPGNKEAQANLGSVLVKLDRLADAEAPCRAALALDGSLLSAHQNLSAVLAQTDPIAARHHRDVAYRSKQVFIEPARQETCRVLVLAAADAGNVPLRHLMPQSCVTLIRWYIEYATPGQAADLPPYDLVFNAIGEADFMPEITAHVSSFLNSLRHPPLNAFEAIANTGRDKLPALLADMPHAVIPATIRYERPGKSLPDVVAAAQMSPPVLLRPFGAHGGQGVVKVDYAGHVGFSFKDGGYVTQFVDFRSQDGWYRKYRVIFVDGQAFPYHLAISPMWLVHYWTSGMEADEARRAEERAFLADPAAAIGHQAWATIEQIGRRLALDYGGIDFGLLADGRVLVFEANATMLVHPERDPVFAYREPAVAAIQQAFMRMMDARRSTFALPGAEGVLGRAGAAQGAPARTEAAQ